MGPPSLLPKVERIPHLLPPGGIDVRPGERQFNPDVGRAWRCQALQLLVQVRGRWLRHVLPPAGVPASTHLRDVHPGQRHLRRERRPNSPLVEPPFRVDAVQVAARSFFDDALGYAAEGAAGGCLKCIAMQYDPAKFSPAERPAEADGTLGRGHLDSYSSPARAAAGVLPPTHSDPDRRASSRRTRPPYGKGCTEPARAGREAKEGPRGGARAGRAKKGPRGGARAGRGEEGSFSMENRFGALASGTPEERSARREFELLLLLAGSRKDFHRH